MSRQQEYIDYMRQFFRDNDQLPPIAVLADGMGVSGNAAAEMIVKIERDGVIQRNSVNKWMWVR